MSRTDVTHEALTPLVDDELLSLLPYLAPPISKKFPTNAADAEPNPLTSENAPHAKKPPLLLLHALEGNVNNDDAPVIMNAVLAVATTHHFIMFKLYAMGR